MAQEKGGEFTKQDAVSLIGGRYYCNEDKHVGDLLSRMVDSQFIVRIKPGHFKLPVSRNGGTKLGEADPAQQSLF